MGATEPPSPVTSVVIPWVIFGEHAVVDQRVDLRLAHHVDEAGRHNQPAHVQGLSSRRPFQESDGRNAAPRMATSPR